MAPEEMIFAATSDVAGKLRGKAFPAADLSRRTRRGVGWAPTNVQITCFDAIAESPYGAVGEQMLVPDPAAEAVMPGPDGAPVRIMLGDIRELDGAPWECCTRGILAAALARLEAASGLTLTAAFEHEFHFRDRARPAGDAYTAAGYRVAHAFGADLMGALRAAGMTPDSFMKEYGPGQYEVTVGAKPAARAADEAALLREITAAVAENHGERVSFTPLRHPDGVGNGVHIHMSLWTPDGAPATHDPGTESGLSPVAGAFAAGICRHMPAIVALTAPSVLSYTRLTPHRWSAAYNNLGREDREAGLRICPVTAADPVDIARQFNIEYRAGDAAASPHLALAALVHAGAQGIEEGLATPGVTAEDVSILPEAEIAARGLERLPETLEAALARFAGDAAVPGWFAGRFAEVYRLHKEGEIAALDGCDLLETCRRYEDVY
ncbi:MAG: glutamine synthetase family protein [Pseudomonadota bacterium]